MGTYVGLEDDQLLNQVVELGHFQSKEMAVHTALTEYIKILKRQQLLKLRGKIDWQGDLEQLRSTRLNQI